MKRTAWLLLLLPPLGLGCNVILGLDGYCDTFPSKDPCLGNGGHGAGTTSASGSGGGSSSTGTPVGCSNEGATRSCYDGPPKTDGVGHCKRGKQTCTDGTWSACDGEKLPQAEVCALGSGDEDCDGSACSEPLWVKTFPNARTASADFADSGELYIAGFFSGSAFGLSSSGGGRDGYIAKLDAEKGKQIWSVAIGGGTSDSITKVRAHGATVTAVGLTQGGTIEGATIGAGLFIVQFSDQGTLNWIKGCAGGKFGDLSIDPLTGDAMLSGYFSTLDCGTGTLTASSPSDPFIARFAAADGTPDVGNWPTTGDNFVEGGATDQLGAVILTGNTATAWNWNGADLAAGAFVAKANAPGGSIAWSRVLGQGLPFEIAAVKDVVIGSSCNGPFDFGGGSLTPVASGTTDDICVAKLSSAGGQLWAKRFGSGSEMEANSIALDGTTGEMFLLGHAQNGVTPIDGLMATETDFVAAFDTNGNAEWVDSLSFNLGGAIAAHKRFVAIAGSFSMPADVFGPRPVSGDGVTDSFVAMIQR